MPPAMARSRPEPSPPQRRAPTTAEVQRFDEANVARLGLISIQERIPPDHTSWTVEYTVEGRPARLSCLAHAEYGGVPHGIDNDVSLALIALYQEAGSPENGTFDTTAYRILRVIGLGTGGHYYRALKDSLDRLTTATYVASNAWRSSGKWQTVKFRYIDRLEYTSDDDRLVLSGASVLRLTLAQDIVASVRARYLKPIDLDFLTSLQRPLTRALYRLLDARRNPAENVPDPVASYAVNIVEWAEACKLVDKKPARIRRTLEGAHEELLSRRYLAAVTYEGRGEAQTVHYDFAPPTVSEDDAAREAVARLARHGVAPGVARDLVRTLGAERVAERAALFEALLRGGYAARNRPALLVDVVRDEDGKYLAPEGFTPPRPVADDGRAARDPRREERAAQERAEREWRALGREEQVEQAFRTLSLVFGRRLSTAAKTELREAMRDGRLDPGALLNRALGAAAALRLEDLALELTCFVEGRAPNA